MADSPQSPRHPAPKPAPGPHYTVVGIDPGSTTGLVALRIAGHKSRPLDTARWQGNAALATAHRLHRSDAENRAALFVRVRDWLNVYAPAHVVIEEPSDATPRWNRQGGESGAAATGTLFLLGAHFGLVLAAAQSCISLPRIYTYQVQGSKRKGKEGWMPRGQGGRPMRRDLLLGALRTEARQHFYRPLDGVLPAPPKDRNTLDATSVLSDHELMAYGVLCYHLRRQPTL